jgi:aryl-alcohol dehydrogenase-like predicted oxidoreductase
MQWGCTADVNTSFEVMDAFFEAGGNFVDTADIYSRWVEGNDGGVSEEIIGRWMKVRSNREDVVLATKVRGRMWDGPNGEGLSRAHIIRACEDSLRRLQTDHIDLYQTHFYDVETPIAETMDALDTLVRQGKVRYAGCSNYTAWRLMQALWTSDSRGLARYDSIQPHYNLVNRAEFERELKDVVTEYEIGVVPYSPLAGGFLTGKYSRESVAHSVRADDIKTRYFNDDGWKTLDAVHGVADEVGSTPVAVSLAWLLAQPYMTSPIIGANSVDQLSGSLAATELSLSPEQVARLSEASDWQSS